MGLFGNKHESYLGIDIGSNGIKLVELRKNKGRPQLWTYGVAERKLDIHTGGEVKHLDDLLEEKTGVRPNKKQDQKNLSALMSDGRIEEYASLLKELVKKTRATTTRATSSLPVSQVFHTVINFPKIEKKQIDEIVKAEVEKLLPRATDDMQIVHQEVSMPPEDAKRYTRLLVTAAPKQLVAFYTAIFQKAGLQLIELETEAFALSRSLVGKDNSVSMVLDIGAERTNFFIIDNGLPMTHRSIQIGGNAIDEVMARKLGMPVDQVSQIKMDMSRAPSGSLPLEPFIRALDPITKEVQYNFELYLRQSGNQAKRPEKIVLTGGSAAFPPLIEYLKKEFPLRIFIGDPWARVIYQDGLKPILDEVGPRMAVSIGLALRNFK